MEISERPNWQLHSTLFTIRLWQEALDPAPGETRMQVKHVLSGETRYFRDWTHLAEYLQQKLYETDQVEPSKGETHAR